MNRNGTEENLVASHPENTNAAREGVYSRGGRMLQARAQEIADEVMSASHTVPLDRVAADEIGAILALCEAMDRDIERRGTLTREGEARRVVQDRLRASARLESWLRQFALTPASRADWARSMAEGSLSAEIARRTRQTSEAAS